MVFIIKKDGKKLKILQKMNKLSFSKCKRCTQNFIKNFLNKLMKMSNTSQIRSHMYFLY